MDKDTDKDTDKHTDTDKNKKYTVLSILRTNALTILVLAAFSTLLTEGSVIHAVFGIMVIYAWVYFIHRGLHLFPTSGPFAHFNPHVFFHHQHDKTIDRRLELAMESVNDMGMSLSLIAVQKLVGITLVPTSIIVFYGILYMSVHIFNYSVVGNPTHRNHHRNMYTNYGPDTLDHIFGTSFDGELEDLTPITLNAVVAVPLTLGLKAFFQWSD